MNGQTIKTKINHYSIYHVGSIVNHVLYSI